MNNFASRLNQQELLLGTMLPLPVGAKREND
jgi:hypothetical protein